MAKSVRGLLVEFALFVIFYCLDLGINFAMYSEADGTRKLYQKIIGDPQYLANATKSLDTCDTFFAEFSEYDEKIYTFKIVSMICLFFIVVSLGIFTCNALGYLWFIIGTFRDEEFISVKRENYLKMKLLFGAVMSICLDISCSCIAVDMFADREGPTGLDCWACIRDPVCKSKRDYTKRRYTSLACLMLTLGVLCLLNLWKGITTFYRWSKPDKFDCWPVRSCVSLFVGAFFCVICLTPALGVFKYKLFRLPSQQNNVFSQFTDSLFMIGLLGWIIFSVIGICLPLVNCIRIQEPEKKNRPKQEAIA